MTRDLLHWQCCPSSSTVTAQALSNWYLQALAFAQLRLQAEAEEKGDLAPEALPELPIVTCPATTSVAQLRQLVCQLLSRARGGSSVGAAERREGCVDPQRVTLRAVIQVCL